MIFNFLIFFYFRSFILIFFQIFIFILFFKFQGDPLM